jgi:Cu-processing system permease protein
VLQDDKARGLGFSILLWLILAVVYDGLVLFIVYYFDEYPLEKIMIALSIINPIDLGRILFLMKFNISALMGYTGAVFQQFFGSLLGILISLFCLLAWIIIPFLLSRFYFKKRDF